MRNVYVSIKAVFAVMLLGILAIMTFDAAQTAYMCKKTFLISNTGIVLGVSAALLAYALLAGKRRSVAGPGGDGIERIVLAGTLVLFLAQVYVAFNIRFETGWDPDVMIRLARSNAGYREFADRKGITAYLSRYPNNLALGFLYSVVLWINYRLGVFPGQYDLMSIVTINAIANSLSCYLAYRIIQRLSTPRYGLFGFCLCVALYGLSPWTSICYGEGFALIFPTLVIWLYMTRPRTERMIAVKWLVIAFISCLGFLIKPFSLVVSIAVFMVAACRAMFQDRKRWYRVAALSLCLVLAFAGMVKLANVGLESHYRHRYGMAIDHERTFGWQHFLMMGMNRDTQGVYSEDDVKLSRSIRDRNERNRSNLQIAGQRVSDMGPGGLARHIRNKMLVAYNDGTFAWSVEGHFYMTLIDPPNQWVAPLLREVFYQGGRYYDCFTTVEQALWILTLALCVMAGLSKRNEEHGGVLPVMMLTVIGLTLYEALFEARARHLYAYAPLYVTLAAVGLQALRERTIEKTKYYVGTRGKRQKPLSTEPEGPAV